MRLVDLTLPIQQQRDGTATVRAGEWEIGTGNSVYTAMVYDFSHDSMAGTYLDLPGHIRQTDDGMDACTCPLERLYRLPADVLHLQREDGSGGIGASELRRACPQPPAGGALIVHALGPRRFDEIEWRSVFLAPDAVEWIIASGIHLLIADVYESRRLHGVFPALFGAGIATVCCPVHLQELTAPQVRVTVLPLRFPGVTQLPCRVVAEVP